MVSISFIFISISFLLLIAVKTFMNQYLTEARNVLHEEMFFMKCSFWLENRELNGLSLPKYKRRPPKEYLVRVLRKSQRH